MRRVDAPRTRRGGRGDRLVRWAGALRIGAVICLVMAAAGIRLPLPSRSRSVALLIDSSAAMGVRGLAEERAAALGLVASLPASDRIRLLTFDEKPRLLGGPWTPDEATAALRSIPLGRPDSPESQGSDLAAAVDMAAALQGDDHPASSAIALFGAFHPTTGGLTSLVSLARGRAVFTLPLGPPPELLSSDGLDAPAEARPGEQLQLAWHLHAQKPTGLRWELLVDGRVEVRGSSRVVPGPVVIGASIGAGEAGYRRLEFRVLDTNGLPLPSLTIGAQVKVGEVGKVLVISGDTVPSPILAALRTQGIAARGGSVSALPASSSGFAGLRALILDDVPALLLSPAQQRALSSFAASGGGLLFVGGPSSFGRGEYFSTALEDLLPVHTDTRQRLFHSRARILFLIDHSGSMSQKVGGESKQEAAMRGVAAAIGELEPYDEVGVIGFDSSPSWILPFTPVSKLGDVGSVISAIPEGGGTDLSSALLAGIAGFGAPGPTKRHMVVLTDGFTSSADWETLTNTLTAADISVSTIAIGDQVDETLLKGLAEAGGGRYWRAKGDRIPEVIDQETLRLTRDLMREGSFAPTVDVSGAMTDGLAGAPPLRGYLVTTAKALARVWISVPVPGSTSGDPLLASWRWGAGQVAAFTSDSGGRWAGAWLAEGRANRLWAQLLRSVESTAAQGGLVVRASIRGGTATITAEARRPEGGSWSGLRLSAEDSDEGRDIVLVERAPGLYSGELPVTAAGLHRISVRSGTDLSGETAVWNPGAAAAMGAGPDRAVAEELARRSGGGILDPAAPELPPPSLGLRAVEALSPLALLALAILLAELWLRSALSGQIAAARRSFAAWISKRLADARSLSGGPYMGVEPVDKGARHD